MSEAALPMESTTVKETIRWYSERVRQEVLFARWGHFGKPVLVFPTAGGDAEEIERMLMIKVLTPLIEAGRIKVYSIDSVAARIWHDESISGAYKAWLLNQFLECIRREVVPAIRRDCDSEDISIAVAGASIGAFNALSSLCRYPDVFDRAVCMSGSYEVLRFIKGLNGPNQDFYFSSPLHFVPRLPEGPQLARLREGLAIMCHGGGPWEDPEQDWRMASVLGARSIPNRVDPWGGDYDHNWPTWRTMLPEYLGQL